MTLRMNLGIISLLLLMVCLPTLALAGTTGKISGTVIDAASGDPLPGVNVLVEGTNMGAATDFNGNYTILNVPPGNYDVKASMIGYKVVTQTGLSVSIDLTTQADFELEETTMEGEEVTVVAKRKIVRKDLTARTAVVSADEIAKAPVEEMEDVLATQAGVTKDSGGGFHIRGGRTGEVAYWVDGVSVTDSYDGNIAVEVENTAIKEMQVVSGAFNAEYGQAMSGIINIATKDGGQEYHGSLNVYFGDYVSSKGYDDFGPDEKDDADAIFMNIGDNSPTAIQNYQLSLDGPVPLLGNKFTFYMTGRYFDSKNFLYGQRRFMPEDFSYEMTNQITNERVWVIRSSGDGDYVPMNPYKKYSGQFKLTSQMFDAMKLSYNVMWSKAEYKDYDHAYKYNPEGLLDRFNDGLTNIFKLTHTLSPRTYYDLSATLTQYKYKHYAHENLSDYTVHPELVNQRPSFSFNTGGENMSRFERNTDTWIFKLDATSQVSQHHQLKSGIELRQHEMFYEDIQVVVKTVDGQEVFDYARDENGVPIVDENNVPVSIVIEPEILDTSSPSHDMYNHKPRELSFYLQDKMEYDDIIVNAGVRFDYFDPDAVVLSDPTDPDINRPLRPSNQFHDANNNGIRDRDPNTGEFIEPLVTLEERQEYWYKDADTSYQVSPRIGIAYPMSETGVIHFSYGHFFQIPKFERLYTNPDFEMEGGSGITTTMGNAELEPEKTVSYEIGLQQQISEDFALNLDMYYRDVRDLVGTDKIVEIFGGSQKYAIYANGDYGNIRGIAMSLTKRYSNNFSGSIDYTYQIAEGNSSDPNSAYNDLQGGREPEKQLIPLDWDQRHLLNVLLTYSVPDNWSLSVLGTLGSGFPYTPATGYIGDFTQNSGRKPASSNLDIRFNKDFKLGSLYYSFFVNVYNVFDTMNEENVYGDTGRATYSLEEQRAIESAEATGRVDYVNSISEFYRDPTRFSEPRRVQFGVSTRF